MVLLELLKLAATAAAVALMATPLAAARAIGRDRCTGARSPLPFAAILLNASVWCLYGALRREWVRARPGQRR